MSDGTLTDKATGPEMTGEPVVKKDGGWWGMLMRPPAIYVLAGFGLWAAFVIGSGAGLRIGGPWDFSVTGALGDSFGVLGALMTSLAAIFTYQTLVDTKQQARLSAERAAFERAEALAARTEARAEREKSEKRDVERDKADARRDSERTYFGLLDLRFRVLADLRTGDPKAPQVGTDAASILVDWIKPSWYSQGEFNVAESYIEVYKNNQNDLGHYFRFTYHIVKFARDNFGRDAYEYVRLLRAQLSNAEIVLIALNCAHGEGREKFVKWVEQYSLLHNIRPEDRAEFKLDDHFRPRAFDPDAKASAPPLGAIDPLTITPAWSDRT